MERTLSSLKTYRVGVIGFGFMGKTHLYGYKTIPFYYGYLPIPIKLQAICTKTQASADTAVRDYGFEYGTTDLQAFFNNNELDIIHICSPNKAHKEAIKEAIRRGIHIYCEKPMTVSSADAKEIVTALQGSKLISQVVFHNRFYTSTMRAKEILDNGILGRPLTFRVRYLLNVNLDKNSKVSWRNFEGGALFDVGTHVIDLAYHLLGEFDSVVGKKWTLYETRPDGLGGMVNITQDDAFIAMLHAKNGATGIIEANKITAGAINNFIVEINCENGSLRINLEDPNWLEIFDNHDQSGAYGGNRGYKRIECMNRYPERVFPTERHGQGWLSGHVHCLYTFLCAIRDNRPSHPSLEDAAYTQLIIDRVIQSSDENRWVDI